MNIFFNIDHLEEVYLAVAAPDEGSVNVVGNAREASTQVLGVAGVGLHVLKLPVLGTLQSVLL